MQSIQFSRTVSSQLKVIRNTLAPLCYVKRDYCISKNFQNSFTNKMLLPMLHIPHITQFRGFKDKDVLTKRCKDCYFQRLDGRWYVFCKTHPRHKQRQKIDEKNLWIITHYTHGT
ncbi:39S ribosomal protein L36, mitochondrial, partial [Stegodyphus mimosarum]